MKFLILLILLFNDGALKDYFSKLFRENPEKALHIPCVFPTNKIEGLKISSLYGYRNHPLYGGIRHHSGIDIAVKNADVVATASGWIETAKYSDSYGNYIIINHGNGYKTLYGHLSLIFVAKEEYVPINTVIGRSGSTGKVTGEHIHYEVIHENKKTNPLNYILLLYDSLYR